MFPSMIDEDEANPFEEGPDPIETEDEEEESEVTPPEEEEEEDDEETGPHKQQ